MITIEQLVLIYQLGIPLAVAYWVAHFLVWNSYQPSRDPNLFFVIIGIVAGIIWPITFTLRIVKMIYTDISGKHYVK